MNNYDAFHVNNTNNKQQIFSTPWNWMIWNKPRNCTMVHFLVIWAWAGWGSWYGWWAGTNRSWGGWGGSWGIVRASCPAYLLPNQLYVYVGKWGLWATWSAAWGNPWSSWELSYITILPSNTTANNVLLVSWAAVPTGGWGGNSGSDSTAWWVASTIMTSTNAILSTWLNFTAIAWVAGVVSTSWVIGNSVTALASSFLTGWPSWGGIDNSNVAKAGWSLVWVTNIVPTVAWWAAWWATGWDGSGWYSDFSWLIFTAGSGSGSGTTTWWNAANSAIWCWWAGSWAWGTTSGRWWDGWNGLIVITAI